ncbi:MAG: hypothetical protein P8I03_04845 [Thalassotalea sp.]|nr:hypothetical protein [Thalassotalea sp.]
MFKGVSRVLIITMMLAAFVGQAMAFNTSMSCENSISSLSNTSELVKHYELVKNYDTSKIDTDSQEDCCGIECCDLGCVCVANACSSFVYFHTEVHSIKTAILSDVVYIQQSEQPKPIATLLYRPPIFIS